MIYCFKISLIFRYNFLQWNVSNICLPTNIADSSEDESPKRVKKQTTTVPVHLGLNGDSDSETECKQEYKDVSCVILDFYNLL